MLDIFMAAKKLVGPSEMTMAERTALYFVDWQFVPLLVQMNYLDSAASLREAHLAAEFQSFGDSIYSKIKS